MDYQTGIVGGPRRRISIRMLAETTATDPKHTQGRAGWQPTAKQIRTALDQLKDEGLVTRTGPMSRGDPLLFRLDLADLSSTPRTSKGHEKGMVETQSDQEVMGDPDPEKGMPEPTLGPESGKGAVGAKPVKPCEIREL